MYLLCTNAIQVIQSSSIYNKSSNIYNILIYNFFVDLHLCFFVQRFYCHLDLNKVTIECPYALCMQYSTVYSITRGILFAGWIDHSRGIHRSAQVSASRHFPVLYLYKSNSQSIHVHILYVLDDCLVTLSLMFSTTTLLYTLQYIIYC